jgi:hypothetical protein
MKSKRVNSIRITFPKEIVGLSMQMKRNMFGFIKKMRRSGTTR